MPIPNIKKVHDMLFDYLIQKHYESVRKGGTEPFKFTTRITNRFGRLDEGYWFHGNEHYIAISFWSGTDWMNKTPNIIFVVTEDSCYLEISVWDSINKRKFIDSFLAQKIDFKDWNGKYAKILEGPDWEQPYSVIKILEKFLKPNGDKDTIDKAIRENNELLKEDDNRIEFIDDIKFKKWTNRILNLKRNPINPIEVVEYARLSFQPYVVTNVSIKQFPGLNNSLTFSIPANCRCIFLTGENGVGKSSILKAIGCTLMNDHNEHLQGKNYDVILKIGKVKGEDFTVHYSNKNLNKELRRTIIDGYAAYGPHRTMINQSVGGIPPQTEDTGLMDENSGLFEYNPVLYDIEEGINKSNLDTKSIEIRKQIMTSVIADILPGFKKIAWSRYDNEGKWQKTQYKIQYGIENADDFNEEKTDTRSIDVKDDNSYVNFQELATGAKSILAMLGDLMTRLFSQQDVEDVADLKGVVLIDEIDIHLHPTFQRKLVKDLTTTFKKVQFIITTHSPIPILGAPENSAFFVVKRNSNQQTYVEQVEDFHVKNLTPNNILTSPIFGMKNITSVNHEKGKEKLIVEDNYYEYISNDLTRKKLREIANNLRKRLNDDL